MISIEPISSQNLGHVISLLWERSNSTREYTRWKYGTFAPKRSVGVLAFSDDVPVGCFGIIPRHLQIASGEQVLCGWFADWYVTPKARGSGVGTQLLRALADHYHIIFGHPGPKAALSICMQNGYQALAGFQRRRRLVFNLFAYERLRTRHATKLFYRYITRRIRISISRSGKQFLKPWWQELSVPYSLNGYLQFSETSKYEAWILSQPTPETVGRKFGRWRKDGCEILFADDFTRTGERARIVLYSSGVSIIAYAIWSDFALQAWFSGIDYIDFFTTSPELDGIWRDMGAFIIPESPIVVKGLRQENNKVWLHGWDRENWTNRSMG